MSQVETVADVTISTNQPKLTSLEKGIGKLKSQNCKKKVFVIVTIVVLVAIVVLVYIIQTKTGKFHIRLGEYSAFINFILF